ncbi:MAG: bile acid:sodium symporter family protein [Alphaproteobacteria bacterium]
MSLADAIALMVRVSIALIVFSMALNANLHDVVYLLGRPWQLARSLLAMNLVMPLFAGGLAAIFDLHHAVEIALVGLAVSPVPPVLPRKQLKAGGRASYVISLLVAASLAAIVFVPLAVELFGLAFSIPMHMSVASIAWLVGNSVLIPLAAGLIAAYVAPLVSRRIAKPLSLLGTILLAGGGVMIIVSAWPAIASLIGNGTIAAIAAFVAAGLAAGHLLGGPGQYDRHVLALATASRHPGIAMAIASVNFPQQKAVMAAVLLYLILGGVLSALYLRLNRRLGTNAGGSNDGGAASPVAPQGAPARPPEHG